MTVNFGDGTTIDSGGSLGKILQVVSTTKSDRESFSISSSSNYCTKFGTVGSFNPSITVSGSNKVYVTGHICLSSTSSYNIGMQLLRGSTVIGQGDSHGSTRRGIIGQFASRRSSYQSDIAFIASDNIEPVKQIEESDEEE